VRRSEAIAQKLMEEEEEEAFYTHSSH